MKLERGNAICYTDFVCLAPFSLFDRPSAPRMVSFVMLLKKTTPIDQLPQHPHKTNPRLSSSASKQITTNHLPNKSSTPSHPISIRQNRPNQLGIIDLPTRRIHRLEQLIHLLITHLLAQIREDIAELADADKPRQILIEDLEAATVFLRLPGIPESPGRFRILLKVSKSTAKFFSCC